jgi:hypothetical protein
MFIRKSSLHAIVAAMEGKDTKTPEEEKVTRKRTRRRESHERSRRRKAWTLREFGGQTV